MEVPGGDNDWRSQGFRQKVLSQIEDAMRKAGTQHNQSSTEMEGHVFIKAETREEYLSMVARLIIYFRDIHKTAQGVQDPMNPLQNLLGVPGIVGMAPCPPGAQMSGVGVMNQMQMGQHAMQGGPGNQQGAAAAGQMQMQMTQQQQQQSIQFQQFHTQQQTAMQQKAMQQQLQVQQQLKLQQMQVQQQQFQFQQQQYHFQQQLKLQQMQQMQQMQQEQQEQQQYQVQQQQFQFHQQLKLQQMHQQQQQQAQAQQQQQNQFEMEVPGGDNDWRSQGFRQKVLSQIEDAMRKAGTQHNQSSTEMEGHVFIKAETREEYLSMVARLIIQFRDIHKTAQGVQDPMNPLQNLPGVPGSPSSA
ncbi:mediator of RNA polymerase II transcription subunit 15-like [Trichomycterus rosablanca]|uniref:mediator of RNA polymerase II transcription subunit 15-like n=1 Tax=Trichomycterus rosablanca TaxID=2290929 RepID=UPI002F357E2F